MARGFLRDRCAPAAVLAMAAGLCPAQPAGPEPGVSRPQAAGRVVREFDFEERETNPREVPDLWYRQFDEPKAGRVGFPRWNEAALSYTVDNGRAHSGIGSVRLPARGGSTKLVLGPGALPVFENADYRVGAYVLTEHVVNARASITCRFLDKAGTPIEGSEARSELITSPGVWTPIEVGMVGRWKEAAWIQVELALLQPEQAKLDDGTPEPHRVWPQDFSAEAWFDDLMVTQLPRVELTTGSTANVIGAGEQPDLQLLVRDLAGEVLTLELEVRDANGDVVDRTTRTSMAGTTTMTWSPTLPRFGWYRARLLVLTNGIVVGRSHADMVWLAPRPRLQGGRAPEARRFGVVFDTAPGDPAETLPQVEQSLRKSGGAAVTFPAWAATVTPENAPKFARAIVPIVSSLIGDWYDVSLSLPEVPTPVALSLRSDADDPFNALLLDENAWRPYAQEIFDTFGQRISHWQIGRVGDDRGFWRPALGADVARLREVLAKMLPGPQIVIPGSLDRDWGRGVDGVSLALRAPFDLESRGVGEAVGSLAASLKSGTGLRVVLRPAPTEEYGVRVASEQFARQAVEAWSRMDSPDHSLWVEQPWTWEGDRRPRLMPRAELGVWSTLVQQLADRRYAGEFPSPEGVRCILLAPIPGSPRSGAMVTWNESAPPDAAEVTGYLGEGPITLTDIHGNVSNAAAAVQTSPRRPAGVRIPVTASPTFIEGVDVPLCRFIASLRIDPPTLESNNEDQERSIVIENSWPTSIRGQISILEPGGYETGARDRTWRIAPRTSRFAIPTRGGVERLPVSIGFGSSEEAGAKAFIMELVVQADRTYPPIEIRRDIRLGMADLRLDLSYYVRGDDLFLEAGVANHGAESISLQMTAFAPDLPRTKAQVNDLSAGDRTIKRFAFAGELSRLRGQRIVVTIQNPETSARISRSILIR